MGRGAGGPAGSVLRRRQLLFTPLPPSTRSSAFTSNNSPAPLAVALRHPAAPFLLMTQDTCGIKTCLTDATWSECA